ncbi:hypothetical protein A9Q79_05810 [Methylophaga sp. 42_25_T18]|nr:hypothetical protein A9Q79_05810 [Methylophaga sp. 42_25_T18]OUR85955.1 hypothetical protein A9Q92_06930 [Methylophaga sp. 42_8_T64]
MSISSDLNNNALVIHIEEEFNFHCQAEFRQAYEEKIQSDTSGITIDFLRTRYIDSASLGMMLILREYVGKHCQAQENRIELVNCTRDVIEILRVTNFEKLFLLK